MTIEEYSERLKTTTLSLSTIGKYVSNLINLEKELQDMGFKFPELLEQEEILWEHINQSAFIDKDQRKHSVKSYIVIMELTDKYKYFITELAKGEFIRYKKKDTKVYPKLEDLKKKALDVTGYEKLVLNLLLNYNCLRTDLVNVKLKNYSETEPRYLDGKIIYPTINKVDIKVPIEIQLNNEDIIEIEKNKDEEYLLCKKISGKRQDNYSKFISRLTEKYLGEKLTQTDFRHIHTISNENECRIDKEFVEKYIEFSKRCKMNGHCIDTALHI